jgi:hypothetical protein
MRVSAEKTTERPIIIAVRDDGVSLRVRTPDRKFSPPHDLIHFVVEKGMRLQRGFWGSVADGAKFAGMELMDGRQKPRANERSAQIIKANEAHLSEAEMIVGAFQKVLHEDMRPHEESVWRLLRIGGRTVESDLLRPTWEELVSFRDQWEALKLGKAILLEWRSIGGSQSKTETDARRSAMKPTQRSIPNFHCGSLTSFQQRERKVRFAPTSGGKADMLRATSAPGPKPT